MKCLATLLIACCCVFGQWSQVAALPAGQAITIQKRNGAQIIGEFVRASDDAVTVRAKQQEMSVVRADVARVETKRKGHAKWWGLAIGAGAGAGVGGAVGARVANESGGDFNNLKGVAVAAVAAAGALIGLAIGAGLDARHSTIYRAP